MALPNSKNMKISYFISILLIFCTISACKSKQNQDVSTVIQADFPEEMVTFTPYAHNPIFSGTNSDTWDRHIRERGYILFEDSIYKMWYTGYKGGDNDPKSLGYATSADGINWVRYSENPIFSEKWTEDMFVMKHEGKYYMYAEGLHDIAHLLSSEDGIHWQEEGDLVILTTQGDTIPGPYGTPCAWTEKGKWYLFYERNDEAIWLAVSDNHITWRNLQDDPVLKKGPSAYDAGALAANQVIRYGDRYFMYYHGSSDPDWNRPGATSVWSSNIAMSTDLVHWVKYPGNPIVAGDHSSPIVVSHEGRNLLFTMHNEVWRYESK